MVNNRGTSLGNVCRTMAAGILLPVMVFGADGVRSDATFVFLQPETSSFWCTATNSTMTIPIYYPKGATKADLMVDGMQYAKSYNDITSDSVDIELPAPTNERTENVYTLTLSFDNDTVQTAQLGSVRGYARNAAGVARCVIPEESASWKKFKYRAVLPVPHGMKDLSLSLNGGEPQPLETGLNGAQGWCGLEGIKRNDSLDFSYVLNGMPYALSLVGGGDGFFVTVK
ncbi:MAG: hypothetical protein IJC66_07020 [Kiritimatiellae bacterium]|nr:hypothetical protein [Kiritimatiellia bacterium]